MSRFPSNGTLDGLLTSMGIRSWTDSLNGLFGIYYNYINMWSKHKPTDGSLYGITPTSINDLTLIPSNYNKAWTAATIAQSQKNLSKFVDYDHSVRPVSTFYTDGEPYNSSPDGEDTTFSCELSQLASSSSYTVSFDDVLGSGYYFWVYCVPQGSGTSHTARCSYSLMQGGDSITVDVTGWTAGTYDVYPFIADISCSNIYSMPTVYSDTVTVEEPEPPTPVLTSVVIGGYSGAIAIGESMTLTVTAVYSDGSEMSITPNADTWQGWEYYFTLSGNATFTAIDDGSTFISYTYLDVTGSQYVTVSPAPVEPTVPTGITITNKPSGSVTVGDTWDLDYSLYPSAGSAGYASHTVTWSKESGSSDISVNSSTGVVSATAPGTATIRATLRVGGSYVDHNEYLITFVPAGVSVLRVELAFTDIEVEVNDSEALPTATVYYSNGTTDNDVSWDDGGSYYLHVSNGRVYGDHVSPDTISVIAEANADNRQKALLEVEVVPAPTPSRYVRSIYLSPSYANVTEGHTQLYTGHAVWSDGVDEVITSSNLTWDMFSGSQYASVNSSGRVTAIEDGDAQVRATGKPGTVYAGHSAWSWVYVEAAPSQDVPVTDAYIYYNGLDVTGGEISIGVNEQITINSAYLPSNATLADTNAYTWSSSAAGVARVTGTHNQNANVTGWTVGRATITLEIKDTTDHVETATVTIVVGNPI